VVADTDVMVIGLGTAGAAVARACSLGGLTVVGVDALPLNRAGAHWLNGVPRQAFTDADLAPPSGEELAGAGHPFHMVAGFGPGRVTVPSEQLLDVDMRHLVARLQAGARAAGARLRGEEKALDWEPDATGAIVRTTHHIYRARVVIDASGMKGVPFHPAPPVPPSEICVAAQEVRQLADPDAAAAFFSGHGVQPGDTLCFTGVSGGYSIVNVRVDLHANRVNLLTGGIPGAGHQSGVQLLNEFVQSNPWVGERLFGGARPIPLMPPLPRFDDGPLVRIGDSARLVFAAHGSGIAAQLVAARMLADTLTSGGTPWDFSRTWQRRLGGHFCSALAFARFSRNLTPEDLRELFRSGLMAPGATGRTLAQKRPGLGREDLPDLPKMLMGAIRAPHWLARLAPVAGQMARMELHHSRYPSDPSRVEAWGKQRDALLFSPPA